jgi:hypothetical protein
MQGLVLVAVLMSASIVQAQSFDEVYNGATCTSYPPYQTSFALPFTYYLYVLKHQAFCHFTMPASWHVNKLKYVLFEYSAPAGASARLCVYSAGGGTACGPLRSLPSNGTVHWVAPPQIPSYAVGAYVIFNFPSSVNFNRIFYFIPVWFN